MIGCDAVEMLPLQISIRLSSNLISIRSRVDAFDDICCLLSTSDVGERAVKRLEAS